MVPLMGAGAIAAAAPGSVRIFFDQSWVPQAQDPTHPASFGGGEVI
jgi:hypothetical protein